MTIFKQTLRNVTFQHLSVAEVATCPNKEAGVRGGTRRTPAVEEDDSETDDFKTDTPEERDVPSSSGPISPLVEDTEMVDVENFTSSDGNGGNETRHGAEHNGRSRESSGSDDSESGFSSSSSANSSSRQETSSGGDDDNDAEGSSPHSAGDGNASDDDVEVIAVVKRDPQASRKSIRSTIEVGYEETGLGQLNVAMKKPRHVDWVADELLRVKSVYQSDIELPVLAKKINSGSSRMFKVEGAKDGEHIASWAGEFKFMMYNLVVSELNITPPFTAFQQTALARLDIAPSQLHPNGWAFLRAFELICIHMRRPVSINLFFHLFELNRNNSKIDNKGRLHLSLRAKQGCKCFRAFKDSIGSEWRKFFLWVEPVNQEAIDSLGRYTDDRTGIEYTKFPLGWTESHYFQNPGTYTVEED